MYIFGHLRATNNLGLYTLILEKKIYISQKSGCKVGNKEQMSRDLTFEFKFSDAIGNNNTMESYVLAAKTKFDGFQVCRKPRRAKFSDGGNVEKCPEF